VRWSISKDKRRRPHVRERKKFKRAKSQEIAKNKAAEARKQANQEEPGRTREKG